jgi:hypothetical protein
MKLKYSFMLMLIISFMACFSSGILAQKRTKKVNLPPCNLTIENSPKLRGFYLGQKIEDVIKLIPSVENAYNETEGSYFGYPQADFRIIHLSSLDTDLTNSEDYKDVNITWQFYNGVIVRLFVTYLEFTPKHLKDFVNQISAKSNLPEASFRFTDKHKAILVCNEFTIELNEGEYTRIGWNPSFSQIIVEDTKKIAQLDKEAKDFEKKKKDESLRLKSEQKRKKTVLRP